MSVFQSLKRFQFCRFQVCRLVAVLLCVGLALSSSSVFGQAENASDDLPDGVKQAMQEIDQKRVRATISFLASDELKGRDTPSVGLNIASAYVAARFRGAGLKPLGGEDYFQKTEVATSQLPKSGSVSVGGESVRVLGVLGAGSENTAWTGKVVTVEGDVGSDDEFDTAVTLKAGEFSDRGASRNFSRKLIRLQRGGAKAILIQVGQDHPLIQRAARTSEPRLLRAQGSFTIPLLLVEPGEFAGETEIKLGKQIFGKAEVKNVIGVLPGSDPELSKEAIIFTAHLDHIGEVSGSVGDTINNGADDDATGVTAVLSLADAYASLPTAPKRSVIFMTFWGEEKGLLGSRHYAKSPEWPLDKTIANINLEMLGRPEPGANEKAWVTGWDQSNLGEIMAKGAKRVGVEVFEHPKFSDQLYRASDNFSFVEKGVIAHSFSAGSLHSDYHQVTDEWERLELKHMTRVIEGVFAGSLPIAQGEATPEKSENARKR